MKLTTSLNNQSFDIHIKKGAINHLKDYLPIDRKVLVISDDNVSKYYLETVLSQLPKGYKYIIPSGEQSKSIDNYMKIMNYLIDNDFTRSDMIIALGGGVVGDLSGFVASTYMRGIKFCNIPTSLLAQVDSSIGGKTAIDFNGIKNIVGSFYQPKKVIIDSNTLLTLDKRNLHSGLVEAIKMAVCFNESLLSKIENTENLLDDIDEIIYNALLIKNNIVEIDAKEKGIRRVLNYGHTIGHAIEASKCNGELIHGECVAIGMMMMSSNDVKNRLEKVFSKFNLPVFKKVDFNILKPYLIHDKKMDGDRINIIIVNKIESYEIKEIKIEDLEKIYEEESICPIQ